MDFSYARSRRSIEMWAYEHRIGSRDSYVVSAITNCVFTDCESQPDLVEFHFLFYTNRYFISNLRPEHVVKGKSVSLSLMVGIKLWNHSRLCRRARPNHIRYSGWLSIRIRKSYIMRHISVAKFKHMPFIYKKCRPYNKRLASSTVSFA